MVINICGPAQQQIPIIYIDSPPSTTWLMSPKKRGLHIRRPTTHDPKNSHHLPKIPLFSSNDEWLSLSKTHLSLPRSLSVIMKNPSPFSVERVGEWVGEAEFFQKSVLTHFGLIALSLSLFLNSFTTKSISLMVDLTHWVQASTRSTTMLDGLLGRGFASKRFFFFFFSF